MSLFSSSWLRFLSVVLISILAGGAGIGPAVAKLKGWSKLESLSPSDLQERRFYIVGLSAATGKPVRVRELRITPEIQEKLGLSLPDQELQDVAIGSEWGGETGLHAGVVLVLDAWAVGLLTNDFVGDAQGAAIDFADVSFPAPSKEGWTWGEGATGDTFGPAGPLPGTGGFRVPSFGAGGFDLDFHIAIPSKASLVSQDAEDYSASGSWKPNGTWGVGGISVNTDDWTVTPWTQGNVMWSFDSDDLGKLDFGSSNFTTEEEEDFLVEAMKALAEIAEEDDGDTPADSDEDDPSNGDDSGNEEGGEEGGEEDAEGGEGGEGEGDEPADEEGEGGGDPAPDPGSDDTAPGDEEPDTAQSGTTYPNPEDEGAGDVPAEVAAEWEEKFKKGPSHTDPAPGDDADVVYVGFFGDSPLADLLAPGGQLDPLIYPAPDGDYYDGPVVLEVEILTKNDLVTDPPGAAGGVYALESMVPSASVSKSQLKSGHAFVLDRDTGFLQQLHEVFMGE